MKTGRSVSLVVTALFALCATFALWATIVLCATARAQQPSPQISPQRSRSSDEVRRETFDLVWRRVREKHFDPRLNGVDWDAVRRRYEPRLALISSDDELHRLLNEMLGELKQSHFVVFPPSAYAGEEGEGAREARAEAGLEVQMVEGLPVITRIEAWSAAREAGLRTGLVVSRIDGEPLEDLLRRIALRREREVKERSLLMRAVRSRLRGRAGTTVRLSYRDDRGMEREALVERRLPPGCVVRQGEMPVYFAHVESRRLQGGAGYLRFNLFLLPLIGPIGEAVEALRDAPAMILDLRGNAGGEIAVTTAVARHFSTRQTTLGTTRLREGELRRIVYANPRAYRGPLIILVDEGTASAAETFAAALQEQGRATVVGRPTSGAALPSVFERLPTGARLQYAIGEYRTPKGALLEGRGVRPDVEVEITREGLAAGRDAILERAASLVVSSERVAPVQAAAQVAVQAEGAGMTAEEVLERNIAAIGGREALERVTSYQLKAALEMPGRGVRGTIEITGKAPDMMLSVRKIERVGVIRQGYDGKTGWSEDPYQGMRQLEGEELEMARRSAVFNPEIEWRRLFDKAELEGREKLGEKDVYVVRMTSKGGAAETRYYDAQTFLLLRTRAVYEGPQGKIPIETSFTDYRDAGGVKIAFEWRQKTPAGELVVTVAEVKNNIEIDEARFAKP